MKTLAKIIKDNIVHRRQMWEMAKVHQKKTYRGSDMGLLWAFAKPIMYIVVFYVAITIGFKSSKDIPGIICPYFVWLTIGMVSFFYMRDMILNGASCFRKYSSIVKYTTYPMATLPVSVSTAYLLVHFVMLGIGFAISIIFGCMPSIYWVQIPFYMLLMYIFSIFWTIATGMISVVYKDFYNFLQVVNQAIFWLSAILFDLNKLEPSLQRIFLFNPITFIVEGYRNSVCRHIWFYEQPLQLACYLFMLVLMIIVALVMYRKLSKRISDVL